MADERIIQSEDIYAGRVVNLKVDTIQTGEGTTYKREVIYHNGAVAVVALDADGHVYMVRQHRAGAHGQVLEIPAGGLEDGEHREECARRELQEEIGYLPGTLVELGGFYVAASYTTEFITIYLAQDLTPSSLQGDVDEDITISLVPFDEALAMALANDVVDSKTVIGLVWAAKYLGKIHV